MRQAAGPLCVVSCCPSVILISSHLPPLPSRLPSSSFLLPAPPPLSMSSDSQNPRLLRESSTLIVPLIFPSMITHFVIRFAGSPHLSRSPSPTSQDTLTLRALVSTKDAGVIIGKGGKNVADLRDQTGVKAGVSKVTPGVHERVLTISGPVERVADVSPPSFSS